MRSASLYVLLVELFVEGDRLREPLHGVGYALLEPPAPELGLLGLGLGLGLGRRRSRSWRGDSAWRKCTVGGSCGEGEARGGRRCET